PVRVHDADVRRPADGVRRALSRHRLHRPCHRERRGLGIAQRLEADRDQPAPARRRRVRPQLTAPVVHLERTALDTPVGGEILHGDGDVRRNTLPELAVVEAVGSLGRQLLDRVRQLRHDEALTRSERATRPEQGVALGCRPEERIEDPVQVGLLLVEDDPLAGQPSGRREELPPWNAAEALVRLPEPEHGSRHGDGRAAGVEELTRVVVEVHRQLDQLGRVGRFPRESDEEVEQMRTRLTGQVHEQEAAAAGAGERALADPGHRGGGDARVDGAAARAQNVGSRLGGERMTGSSRTFHWGEGALCRMGDASFARGERAAWRLRLPGVREAVLCTGIAAVAASLLVWLAPPGGDLAAHEYQRSLCLVHGFTLWDNFWYAGRYAFVGYSVLYYPLAALLGIRLLAVLTVAVAAGSFALLLEREWGAQARWASRAFALFWAGVFISA